jgi:Recombination directionality factor-like
VPITNLQASFREIGRIRMGHQVAAKGGKRPDKLETFRLTSPSRDILERAAGVYGGKVEAWPDAPDGPEFQLTTESPTLDIVVPRGAALLTQWNEMWTAAGCVRRCDGVRELLTDSPCKCDPDPAVRNELASKGQNCKPTTRLSVVLPNLPDIGIWVLTSHGYYAAVELQGTANLLEAAAAVGRLVPARLRIDQRSAKRPGKPVHHYGVPVIEVTSTMLELTGGALPSTVPALAPGPTIPPTIAALPPLPTAAKMPTDQGTTVKAAPIVATNIAAGEFRGGGQPPRPLSYDDVKRLVAEARLPLPHVEAVFRRRFPTGQLKDLTDDQRGRFWAELSMTPLSATADTPSQPPTAAPSDPGPVGTPVVAPDDGPPLEGTPEWTADVEGIPQDAISVDRPAAATPAPAAATGPTMTLEDLATAMDLMRVAQEYAEGVSRAMFGGRMIASLNPAEVHALADELGLFEQP